MQKDDDTLICLLDVLGFENLFNKLGLEGIETRYKELLAVVDEQNVQVAILQGAGGVPVVCSPNIQSTYFSDTIIFWCKYDTFRMEVLLDCMKELLCRSIEIGLPLRGAVGVGEVKIDKEIAVYLGQPIISAARAESVQKWIGITLSKDFAKHPYCGGFKADAILKYDSHLKENGKDKVIPLAIDFPRHWRIKRSGSLEHAINELNTDEEYSIYYENTIEFIRYSKNNHDWWTKEPGYIDETKR
ncbi:MAG TPA: hypothetical protein VHA56_18690 [Mucilaginibacter sp.]|nr:hypothetical protein [Mucilaginibacter sp.]